MGSTRALIALGSNLGDRKATLDRAVADLGTSPGVEVRGVSTYHETAPVGGPGGQGAFLNAAASLETTLDPAALHRLLLDIERRAGRAREVRWDARTLDLDLILFGDRVIDEPDLIVPHPRFAVRRFVLAPLTEIAPEAVDPITSKAILELLLRLDRRPSYLAISAWSDRGLAREVALALRHSLDCVTILDDWASSPSDSSPPPPEDWLEHLRTRSARIAAACEASRQADGATWIVSDFDLDREILDPIVDPPAPYYDPPPGSRRGRREGRAPEERLFKAVWALSDETPEPTFAVTLGRSVGRGWTSLWGSSVSRLLIDREDTPGIVAEILAACEASRIGSAST